MGTLGCELVDIDYMVPLDEARRAMGPGQVLAGNLNPVARPQRHAARRSGGLGRMPSPGRPALHRRRRLRDPPRHARGQRDGPAAIMPG